MGAIVHPKVFPLVSQWMRDYNINPTAAGVPTAAALFALGNFPKFLLEGLTTVANPVSDRFLCDHANIEMGRDHCLLSRMTTCKDSLVRLDLVVDSLQRHATFMG